MNATAHFRSTPAKTVDLLKGTDKGSLDKPWIHIAPVGEHPGTVEIPAGYDIPGYGVTDADMEVEGVTVFDQQVLSGIIHAFDDDSRPTPRSIPWLRPAWRWFPSAASRT